MKVSGNAEGTILYFKAHSSSLTFSFKLYKLHLVYSLKSKLEITLLLKLTELKKIILLTLT